MVVALRDNPDGLVSLVICTSTSLVHPTWLARTIRVVSVSNLSMRHVLELILLARI